MLTLIPPTNPLPLVLRTGVHPTALYRPDTNRIAYRSFSTVHDRFKALAKSTAGTDHEINDSPVPVKDQRALGSCVLNARTAAAEIALSLEGLPFEELSRLFAYLLCSMAQGTVGQDTGTEVSLAVERTSSIGFCQEKIWPYTDDPNTFFVPPPDALASVLQGSDNRPTADFKVDETDQVKKADQYEASIRADHSVQIGSPVDGAIQSYQPGGVLTRPDSNAIIGGHSWLIVGVRFVAGKRQWKCRNSWSAGYGEKGYFWIDEDFVEWDQFGDSWVLTRLDALEF